MHETPFERIVYSYSMEQPGYEKLFKNVPSLELYEGFPSDIEFDGSTHTLLVLDDLMFEMSSDKRLATLFTRMRHRNVSTIFITQNLYFNSKYATTATTTTHSQRSIPRFVS